MGRRVALLLLSSGAAAVTADCEAESDNVPFQSLDLLHLQEPVTTRAPWLPLGPPIRCVVAPPPALNRDGLRCVAAQTASLAVGVGSACTLYEPRIVLEALCLTAAIVLGLTAYTFHAARKGHSFQRLGPILFTGALLSPNS